MEKVSGTPSGAESSSSYCLSSTQHFGAMTVLFVGNVLLLRLIVGTVAALIGLTLVAVTWLGTVAFCATAVMFLWVLTRSSRRIIPRARKGKPRHVCNH